MFASRAALGLLLVLGSAAHGAAADPVADRIAALTKPFKGTVTVYARHLVTGREVAIGADDTVRTASTIKLPILCALESLVAAGRVRWDERITVRPADKVSGSGVVHELTAGTALTLRDLATLMIVVSDNTATNLVLERITADAVNDYLDTIGLRKTRTLRKIRGDGTVLAAASGWSRAGKDPANERYGIGVSTSREMVRLLELLHAGKIVSAAASKDVLDILERQQFKDGIGRRAGDLKVQSKSGSLDALRSDVGIIYTAGGPIAMAITVDGMPAIDYSPDNAGSELIWAISEVVQAGLAAGK
jgi:beta-lactamase class A